MGGNKNGTATVWIITCIQRYTHFHGQKDTHKRTNTHNRKSVSEWEEAGRLAGAVLVEDMASVHLSISKHSVIFPLTGEVVISLFFSLCITILSSFLLFPFAPAFSPDSFIYSPPLFLHPSLIAFIFFQHFPAFPFPLHPSPLHPLLPLLLVVCCALSGAVHSATKQSCLQHHTQANQAKQNAAALRSTQQYHDTGRQRDQFRGR